jgi:hypothetical protein
MNNFLDTDKASVIFWGYIAIIVKISLLSKKEIAYTQESLSDKEKLDL